MNTLDEILTIVRRLDGQYAELSKLPDRVARLELWQSWLKGGFAALATAWACLFKNR